MRTSMLLKMGCKEGPILRLHPMMGKTGPKGMMGMIQLPPPSPGMTLDPMMSKKNPLGMVLMGMMALVQPPLLLLSMALSPMMGRMNPMGMTNPMGMMGNYCTRLMTSMLEKKG